MDTDISELGGFGRRLLQREAARWWWAPLVAGIIWLLIAWVVLRANVTSLATVGVLVGVVFFVAAVTEGALAGRAVTGHFHGAGIRRRLRHNVSGNVDHIQDTGGAAGGRRFLSGTSFS